MEDIKQATCQAPINIATVKYWGKRDETLILPTNDSFSVTLSCQEMCSTTTAAYSSKFIKDRFWLNGVEQSIFENPRFVECVNFYKRKFLKRKNLDQKKLFHVHVVSKNNFPTAAGLASSASGYACLAFTLSTLFNTKEELSIVTRKGSGSACRSLFGGFVYWQAGIEENGTDSFAQQFMPETHWPEMHTIIIVFSQQKKKVSSTIGMKRSVESSKLLKYRSENIVQHNIEMMKSAVKEKDFHSFAEVTMRESNQLHAICLDTFPPITYLNDSSHRIMSLVIQYNNYYKINKVAYTFDAGPNATLFLLKKDLEEFYSLLNVYFPSENNDDYIRGPTISFIELNKHLIDSISMETSTNVVEFMIHTKIGHGPKVLDNFSLIGEDGLPK